MRASAQAAVLMPCGGRDCMSIFVFLLAALLAPAVASADQGSFTNSGGSTSVSSGVTINSTVATPSGNLAINCPSTGTGTCAGGSFTYLANDGTITIDASFSSGTFSESCSGGGRGGHITCTYSFTGYISGTLTVNGLAQAIIGVTSQRFGTGGAAAQGTTAYNSAFTPFYYSDTEQILRSDDLQGTNQIAFGSQGSGVGEFYGAYGIALDSAGRIYIADTYNCRIVRIDDMNGTNWTSFGDVCGSGQGQFYDPSGLSVDAAGKIYVLDTGNSRIVRMDDITGSNWISYGAAGSGDGQFAPYLTSIAVDAGGRIYVADTGNRRLVRFDDMSGANWTVLTQSPPVNGVSAYSFQSPVAVALDTTGRIYVADNQYYQPAVVRVDDMTGANWTQIYTGAGSGLNSISVDASDMVLTGGGGAHIVDDMAGVLSSSGAIGPVGSYYVFGVTAILQPHPTPLSTPTATATAPPADSTPTATVTVTSAPPDTPTAAPTETPSTTPTDTPVTAPTDTPAAAPTETPPLAPTATPTAALIPASGRNACMLEWLTQPAAATGRNGLPLRQLVCTDGDPACDFGASSGDHTCTFHVALCLNVTDARTACSPTDVAQVQLLNPREAKPADAAATANRDALEQVLTGAGGAVRGRCTMGLHQGQLCAADAECDSSVGAGDGRCVGRVVVFAPPLSTENDCTAVAAIQVPLRQTASGFRTTSTTLKVKVLSDATAGKTTHSSLRLTCNPHA